MNSKIKKTYRNSKQSRSNKNSKEVKKYEVPSREQCGYTYPTHIPKPEPMRLMDSQTLTMSPQGQITIPKAWREMMGLKPGMKILAWVKETSEEVRLALVAEPESWVDKMAGISRGKWGTTDDIDDYVKKMRGEWDRKWDK